MAAPLIKFEKIKFIEELIMISYLKFLTKNQIFFPNFKCFVNFSCYNFYFLIFLLKIIYFFFHCQ